MILMNNRFTVRFLMSGLPAERIKFGFLKDYAIRGTENTVLLPLTCFRMLSNNHTAAALGIKDAHSYTCKCSV